MAVDVRTLGHHHYKEVHKAAAEYLKGLTDDQVLQSIRNAATKALYDGDGSAAWQLANIVNRANSWGDVLRGYASNLMGMQPEFLRHFPPEFESGITSRMAH